MFTPLLHENAMPVATGGTAAMQKTQRSVDPDVAG